MAWDCYRPLHVQWAMWKLVPRKGYVADPHTGSNHNRGAAVDVTLVTLDGAPVEMPTAFDTFGPAAHHGSNAGTAEARAHREMLRQAMVEAGFRPNRMEWWHYDAPERRGAPVLDVQSSVPARANPLVWRLPCSTFVRSHPLRSQSTSWDWASRCGCWSPAAVRRASWRGCWASWSCPGWPSPSSCSSGRESCRARCGASTRRCSRPGGHAGLPDAHPAANVPRVLRTEGVPGVRSGNAFELLGTGERAYEALTPRSPQPRTSIDLTIFIVGDDEVRRSVVHALAARARAGIRVRLLLDAVGSRPIRRRASDELRAAGGELRTVHAARSTPRCAAGATCAATGRSPSSTGGGCGSAG